MGKNPPTPEKPGKIFGRRIREERDRQGLSQADLVERLAQLGHPMDRSNLGRIERGETTGQLDTVMAVAAALGVAPIHLIVPREDEAPVQIAARRPPLSAVEARRWIRGDHRLSDGNPDAYFAALPDSEKQDLMFGRGLAAQLLTDEERATQVGRATEHAEDALRDQQTKRRKARQPKKEASDA